jgi:hypothetical protein
MKLKETKGNKYTFEVEKITTEDETFTKEQLEQRKFKLQESVKYGIEAQKELDKINEQLNLING